jgi:hypothetical protein
VPSSDRRNRSKPAASAWLDPAAETAASRLIQQSTNASEAAALVLAIREFVANGGGRPWSAPPQCCIAGADGQPWPCPSAWPVAFHSSSPIADAAGFRSYLRAEAITVAAASSPIQQRRRALDAAPLHGKERAVGAGSRGSDVSAQQPVAPSGAARSFTVQDGRAGARRWVRSCYGLALGGCLDRIGRPGRTARDVGKWIVMAAA